MLTRSRRSIAHTKISDANNNVPIESEEMPSPISKPQTTASSVSYKSPSRRLIFNKFEAFHAIFSLLSLICTVYSVIKFVSFLSANKYGRLGKIINSSKYGKLIC